MDKIAIGDWVFRPGRAGDASLSRHHYVESLVSHFGVDGVVTACGHWMRLELVSGSKLSKTTTTTPSNVCWSGCEKKLT